MDRDVFFKSVAEEIKPLLPEDISDVVLKSIPKNNGISYTGLLAISSAINITPTIYLDGYYNEYLMGRPFESILSEIVETYNNNRPNEDFDVDAFKNWDSAKDLLVRKLINYESNKVMLNDVPHKKIEDLALVYQMALPSFMGDYATILVNNAFAKIWDVSLDELDRVAAENTKILHPYALDSMEHMLQELSGGLTIPYMAPFDMRVLTNDIKTHGAVQVLDPEVMDEVAKLIGNEFYVIPSSIHEVLIMPLNTDYDYIDLEEMVKEVNATELKEDEVLSDKVYIVDADNHKFLRADRYEEYKAELKHRQEKEKVMEKEKQMKEQECKPKM